MHVNPFAGNSIGVWKKMQNINLMQIAADRKCEMCGGSEIIIDHKGEYVCTSCGLVLEDMIAIDYSSTFYSADRTGLRSGVTGSSVLKNCGTMVGNFSERNSTFTKLQKHQIYAFNDKSGDEEIRREFKNICGFFSCPHDIQKFIVPFSQIYQKIPSKLAARSISNLAGVVYYYINLKMGTPVALNDILHYLGIRVKRFTLILTQIKENGCFHIIRQEEQFQKEASTTVKNYIEYIIEESEIPSSCIFSIRRLSYRFYKGISKFGLAMTYKSRALFSFLLAQDVLLQKRKICEDQCIKPYVICNKIGVSFSSMYSLLAKWEVQIIGERYKFAPRSDVNTFTDYCIDTGRDEKQKIYFSAEITCSDIIPESIITYVALLPWNQVYPGVIKIPALKSHTLDCTHDIINLINFIEELNEYNPFISTNDSNYNFEDAFRSNQKTNKKLSLINDNCEIGISLGISLFHKMDLYKEESDRGPPDPSPRFGDLKFSKQVDPPDYNDSGGWNRILNRIQDNSFEQNPSHAIKYDSKEADSIEGFYI